MRRLLRDLEEFGPASFVVLVGLAGGVLQGLPRFFLSDGASNGGHITDLAVLVTSSVLWWAAALVLWWTAVRRRRFSTWKTAWHVTLALALADLIDLALAYVLASIQTNGEFVNAIVRAPIAASSSGLLLVFMRSPIRFVGAAALVALGRRLPGNGDRTSRPLTPTDPEPIV